MCQKKGWCRKKKGGAKKGQKRPGRFLLCNLQYSLMEKLLKHIVSAVSFRGGLFFSGGELFFSEEELFFWGRPFQL